MTLNRTARMATKPRTPLSPISAKKRKQLADEGITNPMSTFRPRPVGLPADLTRTSKPKMAAKPSKLPALPKLVVVTGEFTGAVADAIEDRDGHSCVRCGRGVGDQRGLDYCLQHRRARGGGGSSLFDTGLPANGVILCGSSTSPHCHWEVEQRRTEDETAGYWIRQFEDGKPTDPTTIPLFHVLYGWVLLDNVGGFDRIARVA